MAIAEAEPSAAVTGPAGGDGSGRAATDAALLVLRLGIGLILAVQGYPKLFGGEGREAPQALAGVLGKNFREAVPNGGIAPFAAGLERMGVPFPTAGAYAAALTEVFAGLGLALGLLTRLAAPLVLINMSVAIGRAHWANGAHGPTGYGFAASVATGAAAILIAGPGRLSLDHLLGLDRLSRRRG